MRKIIVLSMITLDGVMQAPGAPEEDTSGGFKYGGWVAPYIDEVYGKVMEKQMKPADLLLGRKTFEIFADYWPEHENGWPGINDVTKYVMSKTMKKSDWKNSVFLKAWQISKSSKIQKVLTFKFTAVVSSFSLLIKNDLVDELWLKIHPLIIGKGKKLFDNGTIPAAFTLIESTVTPSGVIIANYKRAEKSRQGLLDLKEKQKLFHQGMEPNHDSTERFKDAT